MKNKIKKIFQDIHNKNIFITQKAHNEASYGRFFKCDIVIQIHTNKI